LLGEGNKEIVRQAFSVLKPSQIILLGNRELDDAEIRFIEDMKIKMLKPEEIESDMNCVLTEVKAKGAKKLYIHIDLDVLDPAEFPFVPVPAAGGLTIQTLLQLLRTIKKKFAVIGLSLVEYRPSGKQRIELLEEIINMGISL
jgi:arginase